ncbi:MAG: ABC transporter ATP-binding protein [Ruminococcaceae bacterium]|nr:ABC transporter ATP-binding protein [Oscillospiraceae bacterium]
MAEQRSAPQMVRVMGRGGPPPHQRMAMPTEKAKDVKKTVKRLLSYIGKNKYMMITLLVIMLFITLFNLIAPFIQGMAIDKITLSEDRLQVDLEGMIYCLIALGIVYLSNSCLTYFQGTIAAKLSQTTVKIMRKDLFDKISYLPIKYTDTHQHGDIMSRMTNDVENISNTVSQSLASLFSGVLTLIGCLCFMLYYSPILTLVSLTTIVLTLLVTTNLTKFMRKYFPMQQTLLGNLNGHIEEMVTGYKTVAAFSKEEDSCKEFNKISDKLCKASIKAQISGGVMGPCMNVISNISFLLVAGFGAYFLIIDFNPLALYGAMTVGTIQAFLQYTKNFSRPINEIAHQYAAIQTAIAGAERVFEIMDNPPEEDFGTDTEFDVEKVKGDINFKDIEFAYVEGETVLKEFDLWIKSGQKLAIVGATGSGKTTVVNLLTRFYDIDKGTITLDGQDIFEIPKKKLRESIGIVLQDTVIFNDTIAQNIRYGKLDATDEEVIAAAKTAKVDVFAEKLTDGYNTMLTEGGGNLSQGQRQLIAIARAVLADPKILILDEATSSIDTRTEVYIQEAMLNLMKGRTSLIIAHRLSTIRDADKIVVLAGGKVVEAGNHETLLSENGAYAKLYNTQFAGIAT